LWGLKRVYTIFIENFRENQKRVYKNYEKRKLFRGTAKRTGKNRESDR
jgi:hypothetical protein